jgi:hypothetical protein
MLSENQRDLLLLGLFVVLLIVMGLVLYQIHNFMPILQTCNDDFDIINKCHCLPGNYSNLFPNG